MWGNKPFKIFFYDNLIFLKNSLKYANPFLTKFNCFQTNSFLCSVWRTPWSLTWTGALLSRSIARGDMPPRALNLWRCALSKKTWRMRGKRNSRRMRMRLVWPSQEATAPHWTPHPAHRGAPPHLPPRTVPIPTLRVRPLSLETFTYCKGFMKSNL